MAISTGNLFDFLLARITRFDTCGTVREHFCILDTIVISNTQDTGMRSGVDIIPDESLRRYACAIVILGGNDQGKLTQQGDEMPLIRAILIDILDPPVIVVFPINGKTNGAPNRIRIAMALIITLMIVDVGNQKQSDGVARSNRQLSNTAGSVPATHFSAPLCCRRLTCNDY